MQEIKFNINDYVKVKLTDEGKRILKDNHNEIFKEVLHDFPYVPPIVDADGYSKFQLWVFMKEFGNNMHPGNKMPFDSEVIFCIKE